VLGLSPALEGEEMPVHVAGFAGGDRTDIKLPMPQEELLRQIGALGKPTVLVLLNGSALAVNWAAEHVPAIVEVWYPGQAGGEAIADVLFGDYNPGGRLPITFYRSMEDLPPFEDYRMASGRTYRYFEGGPLFPFGHGLSYTTFAFENLQLDQAEVEARGSVVVSVDVINSGDRAGDEVVQLYTRHSATPSPHPIKELRGLKRVSLEVGERKRVTFSLFTDQLAFWDDVRQFVVQPGTVEVMVGGSSQDLPLSGTFEIVGQPAVVRADADRVFFSQAQVTDYREP
jgi:beta-glucosidase